MVVTIDCRDTINCKVTIVLCNRAQVGEILIVVCGCADSLAASEKSETKMQLQTAFYKYMIKQTRLDLSCEN